MVRYRASVDGRKLAQGSVAECLILIAADTVLKVLLDLCREVPDVEASLDSRVETVEPSVMVLVVGELENFLVERPWNAEALTPVFLVLEVDQAVAKEEAQAKRLCIFLAFKFIL